MSEHIGKSRKCEEESHSGGIVILVHIYISPALPSTREFQRLNTILRRTEAELVDLCHAAFSFSSISPVILICAVRNGRSNAATENLIAARV